MANLTHAELVTPERVLFSGEAEAVIMRVDGGDTTFLANHSDFIGTVDICVVRIQAAESGAGAGESTSLGEVRAAVHGGFVMVADNNVTILAGVAELADEIDVGRAQRALEAAEARDEALAARPAASSGEEPGTGAGDGATAQSDAATAVDRARVRLEAATASSAELSRH